MARLTDFELEVLEHSDDGNGLPPRCFAVARAQRAAIDAGFAASEDPAIAVAQAREAPRYFEAAPAQLPARDEGRGYLRLYMSASCVAEVEPGPVQLRTGDVLPVPLGTASMVVKSPCGGVAEVFWGRERSPRISEAFGKDQPLELKFAR
jgi:hypothetical protein